MSSVGGQAGVSHAASPPPSRQRGESWARGSGDGEERRGAGAGARRALLPTSSQAFLPAAAWPSAVHLHWSRTPGIPAVRRHRGREGWGDQCQLPTAPLEPPHAHTDGAVESSSATCLPDGAGAALGQPAHRHSPAQRSSPVLHHVHHHPVGGVHCLANQVLEEDEGLHEEVLPGEGGVRG